MRGKINAAITAVHIYSKYRALSFHATSFMRTEKEKIMAIDERTTASRLNGELPDISGTQIK